MGFLNSVSIAQHVRRNVIRSVDPLLLTGDQEIRKDKSFPASSHLFRIYLDNFDFIQRVDSQLAFRLGEGEPGTEGCQEGLECG